MTALQKKQEHNSDNNCSSVDNDNTVMSADGDYMN